VPFDDPENKHELLRNIIDANAEHLGIKLERLTEEARSPSGGAAKAKSRSTRKIYKSLVRKASQEAKAKAIQMPAVEKPPIQIQSLGGVTLSTGADFDTSELLADMEDDTSLSVPSTPPSTFPSYADSRLAFRVWDLHSRCNFTEEHGFVSEAHGLWRGSYLPPFDPETEQGRKAIAFLTNLHLSMSGGASACKQFYHEFCATYTDLCFLFV
jgi:hypothetical protein